MSDEEALSARKSPLIAEAVEINARYGYGSTRERSPGDVARSAALWAEVRRLDDEYDAAHPLPPCAVCGAPIRASLAIGRAGDLPCQEIGRCRNAPRVAGG